MFLAEIDTLKEKIIDRADEDHSSSLQDLLYLKLAVQEGKSDLAEAVMRLSYNDEVHDLAQKVFKNYFLEN